MNADCDLQGYELSLYVIRTVDSMLKWTCTMVFNNN